MTPTAHTESAAPVATSSTATSIAFWAAFVVGLGVAIWVAISLGLTHPLALLITLLIAGFLVLGAQELRQLRAETHGLQATLAGLDTPPTDLETWLARVPPRLRPALHARLEGVRSALPGPTLTPYIVGLLVLLGMVGTFLGMVVTLRGTGAALEGAVDLQTMRDSLATPVKGLGLAFGTSVAGVAASAMLGLMSALARRERLQAAQDLDARMATVLRPYTAGHRREAAWAALERQAGLLPALADRLQTLTERLDAQARQTHEQMVSGQERFLGEARTRYEDLARSVGQSLQAHVADGAQRVAETVRPMVETTLAGLATQGAELHRQLALTTDTQARAQATQLEALAQRLEQGWTGAQTLAAQAHDQRAAGLTQSLQALAQGFDQQTRQWTEGLSSTHTQMAQAWSQQQGALVEKVAASWQGTAEAQARQAAEQAAAWQAALDRTAAQFEQQSHALVQTLQQSQAEQQARLAEAEAARHTGWVQALENQAQVLQQGWSAAGAQAQAQQVAICETLEGTAQRISAQAEAHARGTLEEIGRLLQGAAEAPRLAAELVQELRAKLSDSLARDQVVLEERASVMSTLHGLLGAVQHASSTQKDAIDGLVGSASQWLNQAQAGVTAQQTAEGERLTQSAAQLQATAADLSGLGEAFGTAVDRFQQTADRLADQLARMEEGLERSQTRSDEQLAYYVTQARELLDLSVMSQQRVVDDLRRLAAERGAPSLED